MSKLVGDATVEMQEEGLSYRRQNYSPEEFCRIIGSNLLTRLSHVESEDTYPDEYLPAHILAERIGTNRQWIHRAVHDLGIEPEPVERRGRIVSCYPPFTFAILKDEYEFRKELRSVPSLLTITNLAELVGRSWAWTAATLDELCLRPTTSEVRSSRESDLYAKSTVKLLRDLSRVFPMEGGWYNMGQLVVASGEDREWIERRLAEAGLVAEVRRSALTGKLLKYYPPEARGLIRKAKEERPAVAQEGWLTAEAIPESVGRSYNWCRLRLKEYRHLAVVRQDKQGVSRLHYPPSVIAELNAEQISIDQYPESGEYVTFSSIVKEIGKSKLWVRNRLNMIDPSGEVRVDKKGRLREHYPPSVVQLILSLPDDLRAK